MRSKTPHTHHPNTTLNLDTPTATRLSSPHTRAPPTPPRLSPPRTRRKPMPRLQNKIILITGGARGQGAAEARLFVREGARGIITDILDSQGPQLAMQLGP